MAIVLVIGNYIEYQETVLLLGRDEADAWVEFQAAILIKNIPLYT